MPSPLSYRSLTVGSSLYLGYTPTYYYLPLYRLSNKFLDYSFLILSELSLESLFLILIEIKRNGFCPTTRHVFLWLERRSRIWFEGYKLAGNPSS